MKTAQEIIERLIDVIANIYKHPRMYAETAAELDAVLFSYHGILDFTEDRYGSSTIAYAEALQESGIETQPRWWHDLVQNDGSPNFQTIIKHWKEADSRLGRPIS
jgi:hypothetical protein